MCAAAREWSALSGVGTTSQSWPTYLGHRGDDLRYWTKLVQVQGGRAAGPLHWLVLSLHTIEIVVWASGTHQQPGTRDGVGWAQSGVQSASPHPKLSVGCPLLRIHSCPPQSCGKRTSPSLRSLVYYESLPASAPTAPSIRDLFSVSQSLLCAKDTNPDPKEASQLPMEPELPRARLQVGLHPGA